MGIKLTKAGFKRWINNLSDANDEVCLAWFGKGRTFKQAFEYLLEAWPRDEVAEAFWKDAKET